MKIIYSKRTQDYINSQPKQLREFYESLAILAEAPLIKEMTKGKKSLKGLIHVCHAFDFTRKPLLSYNQRSRRYYMLTMTRIQQNLISSRFTKQCFSSCPMLGGFSK
ncbi:MAG: hypothetical protein ABR968_03665 [Bacteroidales bacterium]